MVKKMLEIKRSNYFDNDVQTEIKDFENRFFEFSGFIDFEDLSCDGIELVLARKVEANKEKRYVPAYLFDICLNKEKIGLINIRIGFTEGLYYGGSIGYEIAEAFRGNGYAVIACKLIAKVARAHKMTILNISNREDNIASIRVCQKLGAKYIRTVLLPEENEMRKEGHDYENIWVWEIEDKR